MIYHPVMAVNNTITMVEKEQGGRIKDLSVEITFDTGKAKNWKNLHLEMDKQEKQNWL